MEETAKTKESDSAFPQRKRKLCEVCEEVPAKYCCPRCTQRTCSLECVKKHKVMTECNGQRNKTAYVAMKAFTDSHLLSDYRFLEDAGRKSQSCKRDFVKMRKNIPKSLQKLIRQAASQGIELRTMPYPMSKRKNNSTFFLYRPKKILWQIEWLFPQADVQTIDKKQDESTLLVTVLNKYINGTDSDPIIRHQLREYIKAGVNACTLLMKAEGRPANETRYHVLDKDKSIVDNLRGKVIVEYPTVLVVLNSHCQEYPQLSKEEEAELWRGRRKSNYWERSDRCQREGNADLENVQDGQKPSVPDNISDCSAMNDMTEITSEIQEQCNGTDLIDLNASMTPGETAASTVMPLQEQSSASVLNISPTEEETAVSIVTSLNGQASVTGTESSGHTTTIV